MGIIVISGKSGNNGLQNVPDGVNYKLVVTDPVTGRYYTATLANSSNVQIIDTDFTITLKANELLEYICFKNATELQINIGFTQGGSEIFSGIIKDAQPNALMFFAEDITTLYISGILPNTTIKTKYS